VSCSRIDDECLLIQSRRSLSSVTYERSRPAPSSVMGDGWMVVQSDDTGPLLQRQTRLARAWETAL
jgi:hypothetical protein